MRVLPFGIAVERIVHYFGPNGVHAVPLGVALEQSVHYIGLSGVHVLPLGIAAERTFAWGFHEHSTIATEWIKLENTHLPSPPQTCPPKKCR